MKQTKRANRVLKSLLAACVTLGIAMESGAIAADKIRVGEGPFITGGAFYIPRE